MPVQKVVTSQRKLYFDADESLLTDDEDHDPNAMVEEKENQIFNTQASSPERRSLVTVTLKSQRVSERRESTESVEFQMAKLEISQSQRLTDDEKRSQVLFGTESTNQGTFIGDCIMNVVKQEQVAVKESIGNETNFSIASIVTISSTNTSVEVDPQDEEEEVVISDDESSREVIDDHLAEPVISEATHQSHIDDEDFTHFSGTLPSKSSEPNCSAPDSRLHPESLITSSVMRKLSDFFNKIPDLDDEPENSAIDLTISETPPKPHSPVKNMNTTALSLPDTLENETSREDEEEVIENSQEDIIPFMTPAKVFTPRAAISQPSTVRTQKGSQEINVRTQVTNEKEEVINISAKIQVNIVIRTQDVSTTEDEQSIEEKHTVSEEKPIIVKEEDDESPKGSENNNKSDQVTSDNNSPAFSTDDNNAFEADHENPRRTSREIAEMDTQSNSQTMSNHFRDSECGRFQQEYSKKPENVLGELNSDRFVEFKDTPKGRKERDVNRIIAEMDTEVNSSKNSLRTTLNRNSNAAELDTVLNATENDSRNRTTNSKIIADMDTELNTEPIDVDPVNNGGLDAIELDEASIAVLNSVYGSEWRTPQLMKSIKRTTTSAETSFQPNMTDFQKCTTNF